MGRSASGKRHYILIALLAALAVGGVFYFTSIPPAVPPPVNLDEGVQLQSFWADDLRDPHEIDTMDAAYTAEGMTLSRLRPLEGPRLRWLTTGSGILYGAGESSGLTAYHLATGTFTDLQPLLGSRVVQFYTLAVARDGRLYGLAREQTKAPIPPLFLFEYDPAANRLQFLTEVPGTTRTIAVAHDGRIYGFAPAGSYVNWMVLPTFAYELASGMLREIDNPVGPVIDTDSVRPQVGDDGLLYGQLATRDGVRSVFALDLASGALITQSLPPAGGFEAIAPRRGGGAYAAIGGGLWLFDPQQGSLTELFQQPSTSIRLLVELADGRLLGAAEDFSSQQHWGLGFLFSFDPASARFERLETLAYALQSDLVAGSDGLAYTALRRHLGVIDPDAYAPQSHVVSNVISPIALVLTRTIVGGSATRALACVPGDRVYGVSSRAGEYYALYRPSTSYTSDIMGNLPGPQWLFWHDPRVSDVRIAGIAPALEPDPRGGTALVALADGRLVAGTLDGRVFAYNPATGATRDFGKATAGTQQIAVLAAGHDGRVYGGTTSYERATLFSLDPDSGVVTDLGAGLPQAHLVGAVVLASDGRVFAGAGNALVVYDPEARGTSVLGTIGDRGECAIRALVVGTDGLIYGGCGKHLFRYAPGDSQPTDLAELTASWWHSTQITAMVPGADGLIYGGLDLGYGSIGQLFAYNPLDGQVRILGMAVSGSLMSLAACPDGAIYAGSGTNHSMYSGPAYVFAFSPQCPSGLLGRWDRVTWEVDMPTGTGISVDVVDPSMHVIIANVKNGDPLWMIDPFDHPRIALAATLFTHDSRATPVFKHWRIDYTFQCER